MGELPEMGPTRIRILEDGSRTDNRIGAIASMMPAGVSGPPQHRHLMHDETFLITSGTLRFTLGDTYKDARVGDYVVVPVGAPHTFANVSDAPAEFFSTFTPAYYGELFSGNGKAERRGPIESRRSSFGDAKICDGPLLTAARDSWSAAPVANKINNSCMIILIEIKISWAKNQTLQEVAPHREYVRKRLAAVIFSSVLCPIAR